MMKDLQTSSGNTALIGVRRIGGLGLNGDRIAVKELAVLTIAGGMAAWASCTINGLGIPGSTVLQGVLPMAAGLAFVPRRGAGVVMASTSLAAGLVFSRLALGHISPSALIRLALLGICLEVGPARIHTRRFVWLWFSAAGFVANLAGLAVKFALGICGFEGLGGLRARPLTMILSYSICGALAGAISAMIFFRNVEQGDQQPTSTPEGARWNG